MPSLVIKDVPRELHRRLKAEAARNRRSMMQEALLLLEEGLDLSPARFPDPVKGRVPLTQDTLDQAIEHGRA